jgi:predicted nucleic acid-binding protein
MLTPPNDRILTHFANAAGVARKVCGWVLALWRRMRGARKGGRKLRLYLDTTVPNHLFAEDRPDRMEATWRLWEKCVANEYDIFLSEILFEELKGCGQPKLGKMREQIGRIIFDPLEESDEVRKLAAEYVRSGALTGNHINDCLHIAYAVVGKCDILLSWNFDHTRERTKDRVKAVNATNRYGGILILPPDVFLDGSPA